ncbi:hypothetical protein OG474_22690 [Kribbella sp. NBC_01505]|uniref:hypothetical protein n=1 Tax=Kribbella sp. NBC_01505 TaxID=2903580 RepID=UPI0038646EF8
MFNKFKVAAATVGIALGAVAFTAPAASAVGSVASGPVVVQGMSFYDDFNSLEECLAVGRAGLNADKWWTFDCQESTFDWDLYVAWK